MKYIIILITLLIAQLVNGQGKQFSTIDSIFNQAYPANSPGATVLIAKDDKIIYRKAFGMANLELKVKMKPESVLQLASITKQFTSVSILILMEQGKLSLKDHLSKYISDFPRGEEITVHDLLNHTSGITSYTNLPEFRTKTRIDLTPEEIINSIKNLPLEFNPGDKYKYSNSGYCILGYIIEKLTGMSYEQFVQKNIFDKLTMKNSHYANTYKIIPNRASGYQLYEGNYENAEYMSTTIPYAAGSLMSTVDDMFLWSKAIKNNTLISEKSKQKAFANHRLPNGKLSNYGYGWAINELAGCTTLEHTGGINGFSTSGIYVLDKNIYAIVLTNLDDGKGPETVNIKSVSAILGMPVEDKMSIKLSEKQFEKWLGAYQFDDVIRFVTYNNGALYSMREGGRSIKLIPLSENEYRFEGLFATYKFSLKDDKKQVLYSDRIDKSIGIETDKKQAAERKSIALAQEIISKYVGVYELQPSFQIEIEKKDDLLFVKATGQPTIQLYAETINAFFIKEIDAQVVFNLDTNGIVKSLTFSQGGNKMDGKKIR